MKDEYVIRKLKLLKKVEPGSGVILAVEKNVYSKIEPETGLPFPQKYNPFVFYGLAAFAFAILLLFATGILPNRFDEAALYSRVALARNQYVKANLALSNAKDKINRLISNKKIDKNKTSDISRTLAFAQGELSGLKLMGEKGKYTSEECKKLYGEYHLYLEKLKTYFKETNSNGEEISVLESQIDKYEKESGQKLKLYLKPL